MDPTSQQVNQSQPPTVSQPSSLKVGQANLPPHSNFTLLKVILILIFMVSIGVGAFTLGVSKEKSYLTSLVPTPTSQPSVTPVSSPLPPCPTKSPNFGPQPIVFLSPGVSTPTTTQSLPTKAPCGPFTNPNAPGFTSDGKLTPDSQRILDLTTLKISLEKYKATKEYYPASLNNLFPDFAPVANGQKLTQPPIDPETHQSYIYAVSPERLQYSITAILSNGNQYSVFFPTPTPLQVNSNSPTP